MPLWIEEHDTPVWHLSVGRLGPLSYRAACGWKMTPKFGRLWPMRDDDDGGPEHSERCHSCVARSLN